MENDVIASKKICVICPNTTCTGNLIRIKGFAFGYARYVCDKCKKIMFLDKNGCGKYE
jgi:transposase-like protein